VAYIAHTVIEGFVRGRNKKALMPEQLTILPGLNVDAGIRHWLTLGLLFKINTCCITSPWLLDADLSCFVSALCLCLYRFFAAWSVQAAIGLFKQTQMTTTLQNFNNYSLSQ
jgi:hypothetical protein